MKFEEKLNRLEEISKIMREESLGLDESIQSYEEGMKIALELEKELTIFEKRVQILTETPEGDQIEDFK
ncbi:exodeoxyribonuclease VII small subunit [Thiospirochaeta perfilievii]|uniref:Exodeoxyribonuclease 7 small subunit n=1 Tax=Thiospirochaeta perfilievii TaxID=252967 RepID=A0A5C1Q5B0_9SPIO|nr:exodeoxyribonuclease VII small subunit [Thiospirochaeta perfilievii]QEN03243.1 exodeoxyribonuclease VII small subunit [Thiospirochaeta perfilievii]